MSELILRLAITNAVLAALLAIPASLASLLLRSRPALIRALWLLVLLKLITPPLVSLPLHWDREPMVDEAPMVIDQLPLCPIHQPVLASVETMPRAMPRDEIPLEPKSSLHWPTLMLGVSLSGSVLFWFVAGLRVRRLLRVLRCLPPAMDDVIERVNVLRRRLGVSRRPQVWLVPGVIPPMLLASWSPRLLIPAKLWERLDDAGRDTLVLHELAHLRRGDWVIRWLELLVVGLFWWYPLAWWARRSLRDAEELCCDAWVTWAMPDHASAYADTLIETVAFLAEGKTSVPALASGAAPVRFLHRRLSMILNRSASPRLSRPTLLILLLGGVVLLPLTATLAQPPSRELPGVKETSSDPLTLSEVVRQSPSCLKCHQPSDPIQPSQKSAVPVEPLHDEVVKLLNQLERQKAELKKTEQDLRLKLQQFEKAIGTKPNRDRKRLEQMEKQLEQLLKEIKEMKGDRKQRSSASDLQEHTLPNLITHYDHRNVVIPFRVHPEAKSRIKQVCLFASVDGGKSWHFVDQANPHRTSRFYFYAQKDGLYHFKVTTLDVDNKEEPLEPRLKSAALTVLVDTVAPIAIAHAREKKGQVEVTWSIKDTNLDLDSIQIHWRKDGTERWQPLNVPKQARGSVRFTPEGKAAEVRVRAKDKAGSEVETSAEVVDSSDTVSR